MEGRCHSVAAESVQEMISREEWELCSNNKHILTTVFGKDQILLNSDSVLD